MSGTQLIVYDAAIKALAECARVDEAKSWQDRAAAAQAYYRQANDTRMLGYATEIRMRAQRKVGEMLDALKAQGSLHGGMTKGSKRAGRYGPVTFAGEGSAKLADFDITQRQSKTWQKLFKLPLKEFEEKVAIAAGHKPKPKPKPVKAKKPKRRNIAEEMSQVEIDDANDAPVKDQPENIATAFHLRMDQGIIFCKEAMTLANEMLVKLPKRRKEFADTARALLSECEKLVAYLEK